MTPWQKIMRAYNAEGGCRGLRLTGQDVEQLGQDGAIETRATNDDLVWEEETPPAGTYDALAECALCPFNRQFHVDGNVPTHQFQMIIEVILS